MANREEIVRLHGTGYSGIGSIDGLPRHYRIDVSCRDSLDPRTSYVRDIKQIDAAVTTELLPAMSAAITHPDPRVDPVRLLGRSLPAINARLGGALWAVRWWLTPYHSIEMSPAHAPTTTSTISPAGSTSPAPASATPPPAMALIRQRFDFSASHRLHNSALSPAENRESFGKCNNPAGHGHNYTYEPCVRVRLDTTGGARFSHPDLEELSMSILTARFDHKHLNVDTAEFCETGGVMPSVENIARVFFDLLKPAINARCVDAELASMTVWETDRTSSTYPG